jgi:hypothetical protein
MTPMISHIRQWVCTSLLFVLIGLPANAQPFRDLYSDTWVAVDALGRSLPAYEECGPPKADRTVGIFYFLWLGQHSTNGPFDITELLKANPDDPQWGSPGAFHHWGQSELGYYTSDSDYAIRRHARMLEAAGIDTLIFDVTNAFTYPDIYKKLCRIYTGLRGEGQSTPQIMFLTHSASGKTIQTLYDDFYAKNLYPDLWFRWKGKPLILGSAENLPDNIRSFFTIRDCWAWTHGKDTWQWLDNWPQRYGWHESEDRPEEMSVSVAQHPTSNIGRSHLKGKQPQADAVGVTPDTGRGLYFQQQWDRALQVSPEFLFITGWNEWVAQRFLKEAGKPPGEMIGNPLDPGRTFFVDAYSAEYSRDIEPMKGGHTDNYYYQMIAGIRRYKGVRPPQPALAPKTIAIDGMFDEWDDIAPEFRDFIGDVEHRDEKGWGDAGRYTNTTGRNDLVTLKIARDSESVYFYAQTDKPLTPRTDKHWMMLFIDSDQNLATGWEGFDVVTNLTVDDTTTSLHALEGKDWKPTVKGKMTYAAAGNQLEIAIPRKLLNLQADPVAFDFHWADNLQTTGDILEFARSGDSAPNRRFNYRYAAQ